ncbi:MAG: hypothetical protein LC797_07600 [Chloroflexi bacterium]|nr:hypothetical protein [Chloroflexota bacterium]
MVRAVDLLLESAETELEDECTRAAEAGDQERVERLSRRIMVLRNLRQQVEASPGHSR